MFRRAEGARERRRLAVHMMVDDPETDRRPLAGADPSELACSHPDPVVRMALEQAQAASQAKSRFLANLSHEVRTPMNGILGVAEILRGRLTDPENQKLLDVIRESGAALLTVLNDVLDFSKIEAGRMTLEAIAFEPADLARRIESLHGHKAREKGLAFSVTLAPEAAVAWIGDPHRLLQICHNLLSNALKFTEAGEVAAHFDVAGNGAFRLRVRDTGVGLTAEQMARVFDEFHQGDPSTSRRHGGTGLGMSIVKGLVTAMGGEVTVDSKPGAGTTVTVTLPLRQSPDGMAARDGRRHAVALPRGLRVLAVDDNPVNLMVLGETLKKFGVIVDLADGGQAAVRKAVEGEYDLYLLDIAMPDLDGVQVLEIVRRDEAAKGNPPTPALAVTAHALPHQAAEYLAKGFAGHVPKPFKPQELYAAMAETMAARSFSERRLRA